MQEVKNALAVYERFDQYDPQQEADLLQAHQLLMAGLMPETGRYRSGGVGVMSGNQVVHMAPPASQVPRLMADLFAWLQSTEHHPLVASAVFHYEFEFIHPFADGNGRMGRLWQSLILAKWNPLFANLPIESLVFAHQADYYHAISASTEQTDCAPFVEFMLGSIAETLQAQVSETSTPLDEQAVDLRLESRLESALAAKVMLLLQSGPLSKSELVRLLGHKTVSGELNKQVKALLNHSCIEMTIPDKPSSRLQKYRLSELGEKEIKQGGSSGK